MNHNTFEFIPNDNSSHNAKKFENKVCMQIESLFSGDKIITCYGYTGEAMGTLEPVDKAENMWLAWRYHDKRKHYGTQNDCIEFIEGAGKSKDQNQISVF